MIKRFLACFTLGTIVFLMGCKPHQTSGKNPSEQCAQIVSAETCQKIGQLLIVGFGGIDMTPEGKIIWNDPHGLVFEKNSHIAKDIADWHVGGVIYFRTTWRQKPTRKLIRDRNIQGEEQLTQLSSNLQAYNAKVRAEQKLPALPLIITVDQESGLINALGFSPALPNYTAQALGKNEEMAAADPQKLQNAKEFTLKFGEQTGASLKEYGINLDFAPDVDVNINPINPIIGGLSRSYSDNPQIVADQAQQFIQGLHHQNIMATIKHFPGHGSSVGDTHKALVDVTNTYQMDPELLPYKVLISQGYADFIMSTHVINGQIDRSQCIAGDFNDPQTWCPGTMSYKTLTELLRNQLHFQGVIVSDDMSMAAIAEHYPLELALEKALNAGVDMFIIANHDFDYTPEFVMAIAKLVRDGKVPQSRIDDAYQHVLAAKQRLTTNPSL